MSAAKATRVICDSRLPDEAAMPLYAVMFTDGSFGIIDPKDIQDTNCPTLTPAARAILDRLPLVDSPAYRRIVDETAWMDEFAFTCEHCHKPLSECEC